MIETTEIILKEASTFSICGTNVSIRVFPNKGERPVSLEICFHENCFCEEDFSELHYSPKDLCLLPVIDVACISNQEKHIGILIGLHRWVIFSPSEGAVKETVTLNRKIGEDTGYYRYQLFEHNLGVVVIYESGIMLIEWGGMVLWEAKKYWDDEFIELFDNKLKFISDTGKPFYLDLETGKQEKDA